MSDQPPAVFKQDVWYQLSEARVDKGNTVLTRNLRIVGPPRGMEIDEGDTSYWQFINVDGKENRYTMRTQKGGTKLNLSVCFQTEETHPGKTRLCMAPTTDGDEQKWEAFEWNDGTTAIRFSNVKNGTNYWLDVHTGNPPFMNDDINTLDFKPAQRWFVSSRSAIDDPAFALSTPAPSSTSGTPKSTPASPNATPTTEGNKDTAASSPPPDSSRGLSTGAAAGIGIAFGAALILLAGVFFWWYRRNQRAKSLARADAANTNAYLQDQENKAAQVWSSDHETALSKPVEAPNYAIMEAPAYPRHELDSIPLPAELRDQSTWQAPGAVSMPPRDEMSYAPGLVDQLATRAIGPEDGYPTYDSFGSTILGSPEPKDGNSAKK